MSIRLGMLRRIAIGSRMRSKCPGIRFRGQRNFERLRALRALRGDLQLSSDELSELELVVTVVGSLATAPAANGGSTDETRLLRLASVASAPVSAKARCKYILISLADSGCCLTAGRSTLVD